MKVKVRTQYGEQVLETDGVEEIDIIGDDGFALFTIRPTKEHDQNGALDISTGGSCVKHNDIIFDSGIAVRPQANNVVLLGRVPYK